MRSCLWHLCTNPATFRVELELPVCNDHLAPAARAALAAFDVVHVSNLDSLGAVRRTPVPRPGGPMDGGVAG